jgi:mannose-1-phosphate guanylyltransferase / mannose-6-phosphate isomerase
MTDSMIPLIMCGGAGTRLWPASREARPKQFLPLFGGLSTFQETIQRVADRTIFSRPIVITNVRYRFMVAEQLAQIGADVDILLEPARRDSGPAIAAGATYALQRADNPVIVALAADHTVTDSVAFVAACRTARAAAEQDRIVTFGVRPDRPATEYGYIRLGSPLNEEVFETGQFIEKPSASDAARYVEDGYLWNSGNFVFRARAFLDEYRKFDADSVEAIADAVARAGTDLQFVTLDPKRFAEARAISVDYAVMEKTSRAAVLPVTFGWSDVGSWQSVWELTPKDGDGNALRGEGVFVESTGSYVASEKALVALFGVHNLVVVAAGDAVLVTDRAHVADVKRLVERLKQVAPNLVEEHVRVHRPWGFYQSLDQGGRYQVKRIVVTPGGRLSLQMHHHRAEHWVVVRGTARITIGDEVKTVHENGSTYIPIGAKHRLENPGKIDLELIEVQSGSYLGEDDIVRFDDDYRRL